MSFPVEPPHLVGGGPIRPIEVAQPVRSFPGGSVFQGAGNSHFTHDQDVFHATTEIPGLGQGMSISDRFKIDEITKW